MVILSVCLCVIGTLSSTEFRISSRTGDRDINKICLPTVSVIDLGRLSQSWRAGLLHFHWHLVCYLASLVVYAAWSPSVWHVNDSFL